MAAATPPSGSTLRTGMRRLNSRTTGMAGRTDTARRRYEGFVFLLLAVLIWPFIAVGIVAGWGFVVWMYYLFTGPPGPV